MSEPNPQETLLDASKTLLEKEVIELRKQLHQIPELAFEESKTAELASRYLQDCGFEVKAGIASTGLIADSAAGSDKVRIAVRADMDGLPINEENRLTYASQHPGRMHACGHDANMACVLGVAKSFQQDNSMALRILLQPADEVEGNHERSASKEMIAAGALNGINGLLGIHVDATLPTGEALVVRGPVLKPSTSFEISIKGPVESSMTPICDTSALRAVIDLLSRLEKGSSKLKAQGINLSITHFSGNSGDSGVPPDKVQLRGQASDESGSKSARELIETLSEKVSKDHEVEIVTEFSALDDSFHLQSQRIEEELFQSAKEILGESRVRFTSRRSWSKSFSNFAAVVPSAFLILGVELSGSRRIHHSATFDLEEKALLAGTTILSRTAERIAK